LAQRRFTGTPLLLFAAVVNINLSAVNLSASDSQTLCSEFTLVNINLSASDSQTLF